MVYIVLASVTVALQASYSGLNDFEEESYNSGFRPVECGVDYTIKAKNGKMVGPVATKNIKLLILQIAKLVELVRRAVATCIKKHSLEELQLIGRSWQGQDGLDFRTYTMQMRDGFTLVVQL